MVSDTVLTQIVVRLTGQRRIPPSLPGVRDTCEVNSPLAVRRYSTISTRPTAPSTQTI